MRTLTTSTLIFSLLLLAPAGLAACDSGGDGGDGNGETGGDGGGDGDGDFDQCAAVPGDMVCIEANTFTMGFAAEALSSPVREVSLDTYWMDIREATAGAYQACVDAGDCTPGGTSTDKCNFGKADRADHPINCITWSQAEAFCAHLGKRLPTEAEWEHAARGDTDGPYPWGEETPSCQLTIWNEASYGGTACGNNGTFPVNVTGGAGASPYGIWTMAGHVREWVADWRGDYDPSETTNPTGPAEGEVKVVRGGDFTKNTGAALAVTKRDGLKPESASDTAGVRCAQTPVPPM